MATDPTVNNKFKPGQKVTDALIPLLGKTSARAPEVKGLSLWNPVRQGMNFVGDILTGGRKANDAVGTGFGDTIFGVEPGYYAAANAKGPSDRTVFQDWWPRQNNTPVKSTRGGFGGSFGPPKNRTPQTDTGAGEQWSPMGLADALAQVRALMDSEGYDGGRVSYDPLRNAARTQWADADARTLAMYQQLQKAIGDDAGTINKTYDQAVAGTNAATEFANQQNLQSQQGINSMLTQQAQALGIQEAVGNDITNGNLAGRDALDRAADTTARGQITSNQMVGNRASALDYNTDLVGSAGLAGAQARMARQNELNRLLAQYDVDEQEANKAAQQNRQNREFDLAQFLMGTDRSDFESRNQLQRWITQDANDQQRWEAEFMAQASGKQGDTKYDRQRAWAQALADYGWENEPKLSDEQRNKIIKQSNYYMGL